MRSALVALGLVAVTAIAAPVRAQSAGSCADSREDELRYARIFTVLKNGQGPARRWWYAWTTSYAVETVGQGVLAAVTTSRGTRVDSIVGTAESAIGVIGMFTAVPRTPMWAADELLAMDARTACGRARRLRRAEKLLEKSADEERSGRSWTTQLLGGVINLAAPAVLWFGYKRYASGWYTLGPGLAIQEAQILTQPKAAISAWSSYQALKRGHRQAVSFTPFFGGAAVTGTF